MRFYRLNQAVGELNVYKAGKHLAVIDYLVIELLMSFTGIL